MMKTQTVPRRFTASAVVFGLMMLFAGSAPSLAIAPISVLNHMEESWGRLERFQADLHQSVRDLVREQERRYAGALCVQRGEKLRLDYQLLSADAPGAATEAPAGIASASFTPDDIYLADREYLVHFDRAAQVVTRQYLAEAALPPIVQALAGSRQLQAEEFRENYFIKPVEEGQLAGQPTYLLRFTPKGQEKESLVRYDLWVNEKSYFPVRLRVTSPEEVVEIDFSRFQTEAPLPENIFDVRMSPDSQFIDQTLDL